ncbi:secretin N-terminal domain-containing protein [Kordiimonas aquimaris]|uniref:secretin N-terminal domain-containing protein n=1 Tax=Kordiimonas aquimaris TaxID=707591 RepID=UPI0021D2921D|nr:secretin N-terminal domain-containing protein [Kordiimonas aquimaris]
MPTVRQTTCMVALTGLLLSGCSGVTGGGPDNSVMQPEIRRQFSSALASAQASVQPPAISESDENVVKNLAAKLNGFSSEAKNKLPEADAEILNLDLTNIGVRDLAELVLGELLQANFLIEDDVAGRVTVSTPRGLKKTDLLPLLSAAIQSQNAELVVNGDLYQVVATNKSSSVISGGSGSGGHIMTIQLQHASATYMRRTLLPVAKDLVDITADETLGILILSGRTRHLNSIKKLVETLDVDALNGKTFGLYALDHASVDAFIEEFEAAFPANLAVNLVPIRRMNALLAVSRTAKDLRQLEAWVHTLDRVSGKNHRSMHVYQAISGQPLQLADILRDIFSTGSTAAPTNVPSNDQGLFDREAGEGLLNPILDNDAPVEASNEEADQSENMPTNNTGELRIIPDELTDRLFIFASEAEWAEIQAVLQKLDTPPQQVMIEATIVEVALNDNLRYGLQFMLNSGNADFNLTDSSAGGVSAGGGGLGFVFDNGRSARVILDALSSVTDVNVISSPRLMVLGEETATLQIGDQVPVASQSAVPINSADARIVNSIEFRDTGVILRVTPHIGAGDTILVDVDQEISDVVATTTSNIDSPTIRQRRVSSKISVQDGETVAFAGLTRNTVNDSKSGIPIARDLPVVGSLFGSTNQISNRSELLILLTPRLVRNLDDARAITDELRGRLSNLRQNQDDGWVQIANPPS